MVGNRGLNTQHVIDGIETRCEGRQDKTNGKWKMDQWWLEDWWRRPPNTARTRRGTDFGGSRDSPSLLEGHSIRTGNSNEFILCRKVTLGFPFLWQASWVPVSSQRLMVFATALEETVKVLEMFRIDWPSCLKVMMDCHFSLLIWAVLEIIWTWSFTK